MLITAKSDPEKEEQRLGEILENSKNLQTIKLKKRKQKKREVAFSFCCKCQTRFLTSGISVGIRTREIFIHKQQ